MEELLQGGLMSLKLHLLLIGLPDNKIIYQTQAYNKLPDEQLVTIDLKTKIKSVVPLYQASEGTQNEKGDWIFIRPADHGDAAKDMLEELLDKFGNLMVITRQLS